MLKLMYITNDSEVAKIADKYGVDRIWIDLEVNGKEERQKNLNTVKSKHNISDISRIKPLLKKSELLVRINPIFSGSKLEIDSVIEHGADVIMLPYFKTVQEVQMFIQYVNKRCKTMLLVETPEAVELMDSILNIDNIDEVHIGLNDLHLGYKMNFMFELLVDGTVEKIIKKCEEKGIPCGFGGIGQIGQGNLPAEHIVIEHYRLNSKMVILSRSFCNVQEKKELSEIEETFEVGLRKLRELENEIKLYSYDQYEYNKERVKHEVELIVNKIIEQKISI